MVEISQEVPSALAGGPTVRGLLQAQRVQRQGLQGAERTPGGDGLIQVHVLPPCLAGGLGLPTMEAVSPLPCGVVL